MAIFATKMEQSCRPAEIWLIFVRSLTILARFEFWSTMETHGRSFRGYPCNSLARWRARMAKSCAGKMSFRAHGSAFSHQFLLQKTGVKEIGPEVVHGAICIQCAQLLCSYSYGWPVEEDRDEVELSGCCSSLLLLWSLALCKDTCMDSWIWVHMNCLVVAKVCLEVYSIALKSRVYFVLFLLWARCLIGWRSAADKASPHTYWRLGLILDVTAVRFVCQFLIIMQKTPYILTNFYKHIFLILQNIACVYSISHFAPHLQIRWMESCWEAKKEHIHINIISN
jgi:hypothetical protein